MMRPKKLLCIVAALMIALLSTGCSGGEKKQEASKPDTGSSAPESSTAESSVAGKYEPKITANPRSSANADRDMDFAAEAALDGSSIKSAAREAAEPAAEAPAETPAPADIPTTKPPAISSPGEEPILPSDEPLPSVPDIEPQVGLLTAGEWNDNNNWGFFTNLVNTQKITIPKQYGIVPTNRTAVNVKTKDDKTVANAKVRLYGEKNDLLWSSVTDHNGDAYLFAPEGVTPDHVEIEADGKVQTEKLTIKAVEQQTDITTQSSSLDVVLDSGDKRYKKTEIMFVVDTTGSMGDELMFLQKEFTAIAENAGTEDTSFSINFYRDDGDDYTTKCYPFSDDIPIIQQKLNSESANGGGDLPEAVAEVLDETINETKWSEDSVKLMFLIFDAPPHEGKEAMLSKAIKSASEKGIRIIPVVSSNSDRNTELFGRCAAISTGGTYVFLTDDSKVGYSHLEPIIGSYKVEKLYDVIIRIIGSYRQG